MITSTFSGTISVTWSATGNNVVEAFGLKAPTPSIPLTRNQGTP